MSIPGKLVKNGVYEFAYMRPKDTRTKWQIFRDGIYNNKKKTIFGHTKHEWSKNFLFKKIFQLFLMKIENCLLCQIFSTFIFKNNDFFKQFLKKRFFNYF